ncbi:MAG: FAD-binding oxidoreductase, partial [Halobacteria archaeon]|nr:FAD-binding oxidoreductase [Halobacteria archaeon]
MTGRDESFWGWGYADEFSDEEERRELADMVEGFLGFPERTVRDPPTVDEAEVRSSGIEPPYEFCTDGREDRVHHTYGRSYRDLVRGFRGDFSSAPDLVAKPGDEDEIRALIDWA